MPQIQQSSYDEIPYSSNPFSYTHPDNLATIAILMGMNPPPVERCRVLEMGCACGGNLVPMALGLPESRFVGIDLSPKQIAIGQNTVDALGLSNIELRTKSIMDLQDQDGLYDYIICHGVYSWVPAEVQDKILTVCRRNLTPNGVAYVSYNTYPGWHMRGLVRDLMKFHVRQFDNGPTRVAQARAFLDFLSKAVPNPNTIYAQLLKAEAEWLQESSDTYVFHEHLEDVNCPLYFHEFAERAAAKGLQYLGEAKFTRPINNLDPEVIDTLRKLSDNPIHWEQYLDFLRNMTFRRSLLCPSEVSLPKTINLDAPKSLFLTSRARSHEENRNGQTDGKEEFHSPEGTTLRTNHPVIKGALRILYEIWPESLSFESLFLKLRSLLAPLEFDSKELADAMIQCYVRKFVEFHRIVPQFASQVSPRPIASPLALLQAKAGENLTNLRHLTVEVPDLVKLVLTHLDGTRDVPALVDAVELAMANGEMQLEPEGQAPPENVNAREILEREMPVILERLAKNALLVA
jgi:methyltransferase-like protein/cyclopropane fatty-acyl-phospholipid synthase-like methyltransferase